MKDIKYQAEKETKAKADQKNIIPQKYYDFLDIFLKKDLDTLLLYQMYNHKIYLEKKQKSGHALLYKMSSKELDTIKRYFNSHLAKRFIQISSASYSLPVLFVKKPKRGIQFCINYKKLNAIMNKDCYPIPLIEDILAQLEGIKYFTKIDIHQAFYQIQMFKDLEKLTTFLTRFGAFKY